MEFGLKQTLLMVSVWSACFSTDQIRYDMEDIYVRPKANIYPAKSAARNQTKKNN